MSDVKKCDRCGYTIDLIELQNSPIEWTKIIKDNYISLKYDLCEQCADDFIKFKQNLPVESRKR